MSDVINGKVIRILNDREVVLNRGSSDGIEEGLYIGIIDPDTENLIDPETGESLGGILRYKIALRITQVSERLAIASTYRTREVNVGGSGGLFSGAAVADIFAPRKYVTEVERLRLAEDAAQPIGESESRVQTGDSFHTISKETAESGYTLFQ